MVIVNFFRRIDLLELLQIISKSVTSKSGKWLQDYQQIEVDESY